jgi:hypothetical protein
MIYWLVQILSKYQVIWLTDLQNERVINLPEALKEAVID